MQNHGILIFMNDTHTEIAKLHEQVNQLYMALNSLSEYVGWQDISNFNLHSDLPSRMKLSKSSHQNGNHAYGNRLKQNGNLGDNLYLLNQHKDILVDDESVHSSAASDNSQNSEIISCEEQVNRLTAQLTAAYYRIASLEEQLLAIRSNTETGENGFYQCQ